MGSSSSKPVTRKLAKDVASSSSPLQAAGSSISGAAASRTASPPRPAAQPRTTRGAPASETKTQAVLDDARDPQLLANLQKIGQVSVPRGKVRYQAQNSMLSILSARQRDADLDREATERAASSYGAAPLNVTQPNRMPVSAIVAMLDARKECKTTAELRDVARGFDVDFVTMERLARFVNAPSVDAGTAAGTAARQPQRAEVDEDALMRIEAIWTEPTIRDEPKQLRG